MDRGQDRDDWFSGIESEERQAADGSEADLPVEEDWLRPPEPPPRPRLATIDRRVPILAALAIVLVLAVLAAAGVFSSSHKPSPPGVTSTPATTPTVTTTPQAGSLPAPTVSLKSGDSGAQVKVLQRALTSLGFSTGKIDGNYGPKTQAAVKRFQRSARLKADGIVGPKTLSALAAALRSS